MSSKKVLENFSWRSWKVLEKSVKEWEPWYKLFVHMTCSIHNVIVVDIVFYTGSLESIHDIAHLFIYLL